MSTKKYVLVSNDAGATGTTIGNANLILNINDTPTGGATYDNGAGASTDKVALTTGVGTTPTFQVSEIVKKSWTAYSAGTKQVLQVAPKKEADGSAYIKLINVTDGREKFAIATFEAVGAADDAAAVDQLVTAINASKRDVYADIEAAENSVDNTIIDITIPYGYIFRGAANEASSAVTTATNPVLPKGTAAVVSDAFNKAIPVTGGVTNLGGTNIKNPNPVTTGTYDSLNLTVRQDVGKETHEYEIVVYVLESNTTAEEDLKLYFGIS